MKKHYTGQLADIREMVLRMGGLAEQMTRRVIHALVQRDAGILAEVRAMESQVNLLHVEIDEGESSFIVPIEFTATRRFGRAGVVISTGIWNRDETVKDAAEQVATV